MEEPRRFSAFVGARRIAAGSLGEILPGLKAHVDSGDLELLLVFDDESGRQVDFDLSGSLEDVLERSLASERKGPGRPRLGVVSREVSLLPRHWAWLEAQPSGLSGALRRLVDEARKREPGKERARRLREAIGGFMTVMAGDRPGYEEASRALYARDQKRFESLVKKWPKDVRSHVLRLTREAAHLESESGASV